MKKPSNNTESTTEVLLHALRRSVFLSGLSERVPTGHSVVLCFMFGPLGVLSHMLTCAASRMLQRQRNRPPRKPSALNAGL